MTWVLKSQTLQETNTWSNRLLSYLSITIYVCFLYRVTLDFTEQALVCIVEHHICSVASSMLLLCFATYYFCFSCDIDLQCVNRNNVRHCKALHARSAIMLLLDTYLPPFSAFFSALIRGYLPALQNEPPKSSKSKVQTIQPAKPWFFSQFTLWTWRGIVDKQPAPGVIHTEALSSSWMFTYSNATRR